MIFALITFIVAFFIESLGTLVSVIGLSALFGSNPIITALVVALDAGKLVAVTLLYKHWNTLSKTMKGYALIAAIITMTITSAGSAGYLSSEFQRAIVGTQEGSLKVDVLKQQQAKYEERKKQIDAQIAALPEKTTVNQRLRLMNGFKQEQQDLQAKIAEIDKQLPELQVKQISTEAHAGPILFIAKAFGVPIETAVTYVIALIIFVFDPFAVFLIIAGNFLWDQRNRKPEPLVNLAKPEETQITQEYVEEQVFPTPPSAKEQYVGEEDEQEVPAVEVPSQAPDVAATSELDAGQAPSAEGPADGGTAPVDEVSSDTVVGDEGASVDDVVVPEAPTVSVQENEGGEELTAANAPVITKSMLSNVRPDPDTVTDASHQVHEVGIGTGVYRTGYQPQ